jgi:dsDNA-specific endonuclease/ATPase MutS2
MEIDLHIGNLVEDQTRYKASEILEIQMKKLEASMEEAVSKRMRRLVIIHGVGQGTLKMQIRRELQEKYPEYQFQDASFSEYGFGATLVHLHTIRKQ